MSGGAVNLPSASAATSSLAAWHGRLHGHFADLHRQRIRDGGWAVFALEHGLPEVERAALVSQVHGAVRAGRVRTDSWLPWIVYSAEIGYEFLGGEFWPTFAARTPGWDRRPLSDRDWLRERFRRFCAEYGGAQPTGEWSDRYSIISWPITHAVVPRDLQRHLARTLADLGSAYTTEILADPVALGRLIAQRASAPTAHFEQFLEDPRLVGQVALALLVGTESLERSLLIPPTLERLTASLSQVRQQREWLESARAHAGRRYARGLWSGRAHRHLPAPAPQGESSGAMSVSRPVVAPARPAPLAKPRLLLRSAEGGVVQAYLELPDFTPLAAQRPVWHAFLAGTRARVHGSDQRPLARGRLLHGSTRVALHEWPVPDAPVLAFERAVPSDLRVLLEHECRISPGPDWLFHVGASGVGVELGSRTVLPGHRYLLLSTEDYPAGALGGAVPLRCAGLTARQIHLPSRVPVRLERQLEACGLRLGGAMRAAPAGAVPIWWDGQGHGEWLTSDRVCLRISLSYPVRSLSLWLEYAGVERLIIPGTAWGEEPAGAGGAERPPAVMVALPPLACGDHRLVVAEERADTGALREVGQLDIRVREPLPLGVALEEERVSLVGLTSEPLEPFLEDLEEGLLRLDVEGPAAGDATLTCAFLGSAGEVLGTIGPLPAAASHQERRQGEALVAHVRHDPEAQRLLRLASSARFIVTSDGAGRATLLARRRDDGPRWVSWLEAGTWRVRLAGAFAPEEVTVTAYEAFAPFTPQQVDTPAARAGALTTDGGLFVATGAGAAVTVVGGSVAVPRKGEAAEPVGPVTPLVVLRALDAARAWASAPAADAPALALKEWVDAGSESVIRGLLVALTNGAIARESEDMAALLRQLPSITSPDSGLDDPHRAAQIRKAANVLIEGHTQATAPAATQRPRLYPSPQESSFARALHGPSGPPITVRRASGPGPAARTSPAPRPPSRSPVPPPPQLRPPSPGRGATGRTGTPPPDAAPCRVAAPPTAPAAPSGHEFSLQIGDRVRVAPTHACGGTVMRVTSFRYMGATLRVHCERCGEPWFVPRHHVLGVLAD